MCVCVCKCFEKVIPQNVQEFFSSDPCFYLPELISNLKY